MFMVGFLLVADSRSKLSKTVISVLNRGMPEFLVDVDLQGYNLQYLEKHRSSLVCRIHGMLLQILSLMKQIFFCLERELLLIVCDSFVKGEKWSSPYAVKSFWKEFFIPVPYYFFSTAH